MVAFSPPNVRPLIPLFVLAGLSLTGVLTMNGNDAQAVTVLFWTLLIGTVPLAWDIVQSLLHRHLGVDLIAIVAIGSSLFMGQYLAGAVILLMLSGGEALESFALRRARSELRHLIDNAPTVAHKIEDGSIIDVPVASVLPGDVVIVKSGESVPVDGAVTEGVAMVDESALTGEAVPIRKIVGALVMSGSLSIDGVLHVKALKTSAESKYQQIVRLVQEAEQRRAPFVRLADRYSVWFTSLAFVMAGIAWLVSHDPIRMLAVLVVATPCPLILATPIAFASGISVAAKRGIIVRNGGALEKLGEARCFVFDKTGTLTLGVPEVHEIRAFESMESSDILRTAASLDQLSTHVLARSLTTYATREQLHLMFPQEFVEVLGEGVKGSVDARAYLLGRLAFLEASGIRISDDVHRFHDEARRKGHIPVFLADSQRVIGCVVFADIVRPDVRSLFINLQRLGIRCVRMLTGDKRATADEVGKEIGLTSEQIIADCLPEQKVEEVMRLRTTHSPVVMVGDGVNDAPAIVAADVGVAMGSHGSTASSEAGDVIIMVDRIERVGEALMIGHRVLAIAKQSIFIGIGLSALLMCIAAAGFIPPVLGAMLQEGIDVLVILNALRVLIPTQTAA